MAESRETKSSRRRWCSPQQRRQEQCSRSAHRCRFPQKTKSSQQRWCSPRQWSPQARKSSQREEVKWRCSPEPPGWSRQQRWCRPRWWLWGWGLRCSQGPRGRYSRCSGRRWCQPQRRLGPRERWSRREPQRRLGQRCSQERQRCSCAS
ncbi:hypothetical protein BX070DRAFT_223097 [Coemansia spiralis]|nr:hypothetical protein BX070DRAFT_223097 [Coemansia spiralis]